MGKQGPCYHCGVASTPLWRNGPSEKPVLCNACGSRWRTKGTLANYTPIHARQETNDFEHHHRVPRVKTISIKSKEVKLLKRKQNHNNVKVGSAPNNNQGFQKAVDEDTSNRSSSGSAVSNSESCAQFGSADASDLTGPSQSVVWDTSVPSRKRTCVNRPKQSSVEKLTKDLYTILHEQQSSCFSGSSEEDLLLESDRPMVSVEIGHGSVLIRHPSLIAREEESEASSLSVDNKLNFVNEAYSCPATLSVQIDKVGVGFPSAAGIEKTKKLSGQGMLQAQPKRDNFQVLINHNSVLRHVDLKGVVNFDEFVRHFTNEEQQQLLKYLPSVDTAKLSDSLRGMFDSHQFEENLSSFQQLLAEGVFDISLTGVKNDDCKTLKRLALVNLTKSKWVEHYNLLKNCRNNGGQPVVDGGTYGSVNFKRPNDGQNKNITEAEATMSSPKRVFAKASCETKEVVDNDGSCFSPSILFAMPPDTASLMLDSIHFASESSDQDLLLDVPSNGSFPQAELVYPTSSSFGTAQASASSSSIYTNPVRP